MSLLGEKVYLHGRIRGLTKRRLIQLTLAAGGRLVRGGAGADALVFGHSSAASTLSDDGAIHLGFQPKRDVLLLSELAFRGELGISAALDQSKGAHTGDQAAARAGLTAAQIRALALYDVLRPHDGLYSYRDLLVARAVARLHSTDVKLSKIVAVAHALELQGKSLANVRLGAAPWGQLLQETDGNFTEIDGQLLLPISGEDIDADGAFARAEVSEREGDLQAARRWYELASRLDARDGVIPFNLGNVLDSMGLPREAELAYRQAVARRPDLADAWYNLGVLNEKTGNDGQALANYERAFAVEPSYVDALHNSALLNMRASHFDKALALWTRIEASADANTEEARRLAQLCRFELRQKSVT